MEAVLTNREVNRKGPVKKTGRADEKESPNRRKRGIKNDVRYQDPTEMTLDCG